MGAGEYEAGDEDVGGEDPVATPSDPRAVTLPAAVKFDLATKGFPLDSDGLYLSAHPVDQAVNMALGVVAGSIASDPAFGSRLRRIRFASNGPVLQKAVEDAVRIALAARLSAGDISILKIETDAPARGSLFVAVSYVNLRLDSTTRTARAQLV